MKIRLAKQATRFLATGALALGLAGQAGIAAAAECLDPESLTFAIIPTEETTAELELYKPVTDRLAEQTGKKVSFFMPTSYASVVEGMLGGFVHVGVLGPYSYVIANEKDPNIEVFATYAKKAGHLQEEGPGYRGVAHAAFTVDGGAGLLTPTAGVDAALPEVELERRGGGGRRLHLRPPRPHRAPDDVRADRAAAGR